MNQMTIVFNKPEEILDFVNKVSKFPFDMDLQRGRFIVDAKSLLGIMNMGIGNKIELKIYEENCQELKAQIEQYRAA